MLGTGFDGGSSVEMLLAGQSDAKVRTNSTSYVSSKELVANITIDADAAAAFRDVAVTTGGGKKGIGTERFQVLAVQALAAPAGGSAAYGVNDAGLIAGQVSGGCLGPHPAYWPTPDSVALLPLPAGTCGGRVFGVSETGFITGFASTGDAGTWKAARWVPTPSGYLVEDLGFASNGKNIWAAAVNSAGHITGYSIGTLSTMRAVWWSPATGWRELELPAGATACIASALTEADAIAGSCYFDSVRSPVHWANPDASAAVLPRLSGWNSHQGGEAINESGVIAGSASNRTKSGSTTEIAVRWVQVGGSWTVESLGHLGGGFSSARGINDDGQIVGLSRKSSNGNNIAFLWTPGVGMNELANLSPSGKSTAWSLTNAAGGVSAVGWTEIQGVNRAVIWRLP